MGMILLTLGVALWWGAHLFKRVAPGLRNEMDIRMGGASKGAVAGALVLSIILMVVGYINAPFITVYTPPSWTVHLNGFLVWAIAHLLVNGDVASLVLFGGLAVWSPVTMIIVNRARPDWTRPEPGPPAGDVKLVVISVVMLTVIGTVHSLLGPWPFAG